MQRLVDVHEVVLPLQARVGGITVMESHAVLEPAAGEVLLGRSDRRLVDVDPVDHCLRIGPRDRHRRVALATGDVADASGRIGLQPLVDVRDRGEPLAAQELVEYRARELRLPLVKVRTVVGVRHAVAAPKRGEQLVDRTDARDEQLSEGGDVVEARLVE